MVLYDGLHYDAMAVAAFADAAEEIDCTVFNPESPDAQQVRIRLRDSKNFSFVHK